MRIVYVCHYFAPEVGAPSARLLEMSREWVRAGHEVQVVTCFPNHPTGIIPPEYCGKTFMRERMEGIEVLRNWVYATPNEGVIKKTLGHLSFMASSPPLSTAHLDRPDVVIASSPTLFSAVAGRYMARRHRAKFVLEVRDLWPAAIVELGVISNPLLVKPLEALESWLYRSADAIVSVTRSFTQTLQERGIHPRKLHTVTNGVDETFFYPRESARLLRNREELRDKFIVLYAGAHGICQRLGSVLEVAKRLKGRREIAFVFVGEGAEKAQLIETARAEGLENVHFFPSVTKADMPDLYSEADACLVPLRNVALFQTFLPSKMFEIMACERPIIGSVEGEAAELLRESGGALVVEPEDVQGIQACVQALAGDRALGRSLGERGRQYVVQNYTRARLAEKYLHILEELTFRKGGGA